MHRVEMNAQTRTGIGKGVAHKLRANGMIPAILYGDNKKPTPLAIVRRDLGLLLQGHEGQHILVDLKVTGDHSENLTCVLQDLQIDPVRRTIKHADFRRVDPNKPIRTTVMVHLTGTPAGVRAGGVQQQVLREVEVQALPANLPDEIRVDVSHLQINQTLHVSDLPHEGTGYTILTEADRPICSVTTPKLATVETAAPTAEGEAAGEDKGKEDK